MNDILIWFLIFLIVLIMLGVYLSQNTPLNLNEKENILKKKIIENFNPSVSSSTQQTKGASHLYKWGLPQNQPPSPKKKCEQSDTIPPFTPFFQYLNLKNVKKIHVMMRKTCTISFLL